MSHITHFTYQVPFNYINRTEVDSFFKDALGMLEMKPDRSIEKNYNVRWFQFPSDAVMLHLVENGSGYVRMPFDHFCIRTSPDRYRVLASSEWLERDSGSGRIWLKGPLGIRVEVNK